MKNVPQISDVSFHDVDYAYANAQWTLHDVSDDFASVESYDVLLKPTHDASAEDIVMKYPKCKFVIRYDVHGRNTRKDFDNR